MKIPQPFIPLRAETNGLEHTVHVIGRDYTIGADGMITSIKSEGVELLAAPMRVVSVEDGEPSDWDMNYPENESESFIQRRSDEEIVICGAKQSDRFIIDTCYKIDYDGCIDIDFKLMTRGKTVAQVFGIAETKPTLFKLDKLWLEIPLRADAMTLFTSYPNSAMWLADGTERPYTDMSMSGKIPEQTAAMPFKALLWLGNEERGLGWFAESDRNWQPVSNTDAMELVRDGDTLILRVRLLDSHPVSWSADPKTGLYAYTPITFNFGLHATPVKPFPKQPYIHNAFHLDCGIKVKGNYIDVLAGRYDELKEKGVTTLILHEKWNKSQNWFELSEFTKRQITTITDECHKRGIKVLTYFGYELSSMSPEWSELENKVTYRDAQGRLAGGWWRVPFQRDYVVCYNSEYSDIFIDGVTKIMDECHTDGVYLDGTHHARLCYSTEHGCGWYDHNGKLHGSYCWKAVRKLFKRLYDVVGSRGGEINVHAFGFVNFTAIPYIHQNWYGENLQFALMKGSTADMDLDYFRAEYIGQNIGAPVEFIAYENRPYWTFEMALASSLLHGILPRPNDIGHPLELMSSVWKVIDGFPVDKSEWLPYWKNDVKITHDKVKVSYYRYTDLAGDVQILAFVVNISASTVEEVVLGFSEEVSTAVDTLTGENVGFRFGLGGYGCRILFVK